MITRDTLPAGSLGACPVCHKPRGRGRGDKRYCSDRCRRKAFRRRARGLPEDASVPRGRPHSRPFAS